MASTEVKVPDIGDFDAVEIIEVLVAPGDSVAAEDPLITLESDKATMEVPASEGGVVKSLKVNVGDKVKEGDVILTLEAEEDSEPKPPANHPEEEHEPEPASESESEAEPQAESKSDAKPEQPAEKTAEKSSPPAAAPAPKNSGQLPHASPSIRQFARELGVDLTQVNGSGAKGRILKEDVQQFVKSAMSGQGGQSSNAGSGIPTIPAIDFSKFGETETQPLSRIKKLSAANLHRSWLNVPHVTQFDQADITDLEGFRKSENARLAKQDNGGKLTPLAFVLKACANALAEFPSFNSSLAPNGEELILKKYCHLGFAADTPNGLVVPVIRDADQKSILQLAAECGELAGKARAGKLAPKDMQGACFTISSLGGIGGTAFTPIVNAPEVAILGVSRSEIRPIWQGDEFAPRLMLPLSLSYDHRVIDGAAAARFTTYLSEVLGDIRRLLL